MDFILPDNAVSIGNCTVEGVKYNDLDGDGTQSVGEPELGGWTIFADYDNDGILDNNMDATFVNDFDGIVEAGEEEPFDVTADGTGTEALGSYRIVKVQNGMWNIREVLQPTWDCTGPGIAGGGAVVGCPEDTSTNPDNALGYTLTWTAANEIYADKDFGNQRQRPRLTVIKNVVNDDGGTSTAGDFLITVDDPGTDPPSFPGAGSPGTTVTIDAGAYDVTEGPHAGYAVTYSAGCSGTLERGDSATCTITNDDIAPVVTVIKNVVNDNGGTATAGDFQITVDDPNANPPSFPGAGSPGTTVTVDPGAYDVTEGTHTGYAVTYSSGCTGTLPIGGSATCTITNDDIAPGLTVIKTVINDNGGTADADDFQITVDDPGNNPPSFPGAASPGTNVTVDAGAYDVTEGTHTGYAVTYSGGCTGTLALAGSATCTITNDDIAPTLTVIKNVINDNGGTQTASNFQITIDDPGTNPASFPGAGSPGTTVAVDAGAYNVTEGTHTGYDVTYSPGCSGTLALDSTATCTITNNDIAPTLTVIKTVVNDNGGIQTAANFQITVDDPGTNPASFPGAGSPGTTVTVDAGAYDVTEGTHTGYTVTYSGGCTGTLALAGSATCTITNNDIAPTLTVIKTVINDNGGTQTAANFQITVDDPGTNPASFPGAASPGTTVTVDAGAYNVTEGTHTGYDVTYSSGCSGTLALDSSATCTVTNNDIAPTVTVIKNVINDNGGTQTASNFQITIDDPGTNPASFPGAGSPGTTVAVDAGAYNVTEGAHDGYTVTYSGGCTGTLALAGTATCTITNNDIAPRLIVIKNVTNNNGGTSVPGDFQLTVDDPGSNPPSFPGAGSPGTNVTVDPGAYSVTEGTHTGYAVTFSSDCNASIAIGETKTCTVTNDDIAATLTVIKNVVNDNGGTATAHDFELTVDDVGTNPASFPGQGSPGTIVAVDPGAYSVSEGPHPGYAVSFSGGCMGTLAVGGNNTCTVTNNDIAPTLTVIKTVVNKNGSTAVASDFTMHISGTAGSATFAGAASPGTTRTLQAGGYDVSEDPNANYSASESADCHGTLAVGDNKTCTITNTRRTGTITVVKDLIPAADSGRFDLKVDSTVVRSNAGDGDGSGPVEVNTGTHTVSEVSGSAGDVDDYVTSIACTPGGPSAPGPGPLDVAVTSGADITCTITNTRKASVTVRKLTDPAGASPQFAFASGLPAEAGSIAANGSFSLAHGQSVTTSVAPGSYPVSENDPSSLGYRLAGLTCVEDKTQNSTVASGASLATDRNATIRAESGEIVFCTFTNRRLLGQPVVVKTGDSFAYHGATASYTFSVTNAGNAPLHDVHVSDDRCPSVSATPTSTTNDNGDALLDPVGADGTNPETWVFSCSYTIGAHQAGEANPLVNTATVTALDQLNMPVAGTDQHSTTLVHPGVSIAKTGPASALAGGLVTYELAVSNTGDVALVGPLVVVSDALCEAPPALVSFGSDTSPGTLDPGDTWRFSCSVQTAVGQASVHNVANVDATDVHGRHTTGEAVADTALAQPTVGSAAPVIPAAAARLRGPTGCMPPLARFIVTGTRIQKVRFSVDGRVKKFVNKADSKGRWIYTMRRRITDNGTHRVEAQITFKSGSSQKTKTLRAATTKCRRAIAPVFTG